MHWQGGFSAPPCYAPPTPARQCPKWAKRTPLQGGIPNLCAYQKTASRIKVKLFRVQRALAAAHSQKTSEKAANREKTSLSFSIAGHECCPLLKISPLPRSAKNKHTLEANSALLPFRAKANAPQTKKFQSPINKHYRRKACPAPIAPQKSRHIFPNCR